MKSVGTMQEPITSVPEGEYDAVLTGFDTVAMPYGDANRYEFRIDSDNVKDGRTVSGLTGTVLAENTKKGRWISALLGRVPELGENISEDDILNQPCRVVVAHKTDSKGIVRANVTDVLPAAPVSDDDIAF